MEKSKLNYLVIEDELNVCENIAHRMKKFENWNCLGLISFYDEALAVILAKRPDLIFLDFSIRGGNSFDLLDQIKEMVEYQPYIIFFTAYLQDKPEIAEDAINTYKVNKYINKPIFNKLTECLETYLTEAETWSHEHTKNELWIETVDHVKIKLCPKEIYCFSQSAVSSRHKIIHTISNNFEIKASWSECENIAKQNQLDYFFANSRESMVIRNYITKIQKPNIWLNDTLKVPVTKENWKLI